MCRMWKWKERKLFLAVFTVQAVLLLFWIPVVVYCTYEMYLAAQEHLGSEKDAGNGGGSVTSWFGFGRRRDSSDRQWALMTHVLFRKHGILANALYLLVSRILHHFAPQHLATSSVCFSFLFLSTFLGLESTTFLFLLPVLFWLLLGLRRKILIWAAVALIFTFVTSPSWASIVLPSEGGVATPYFVFISSWTVARCISFSFDTWHTHDRALWSFFKYCFYFPVTINGPLVLFHTYEQHMLLKPLRKKTRKETVEDVLALVVKLVRISLWILIIELALHFLRFRPLAMKTPVLSGINWWALCGVAHWLGQLLQLKFLVIYGLSSAVAEFEGMEMPSLPKCIGYRHRYSTLWKNFDRGMYDFLIRYTYVPTIECLRQVDPKKRIHPEVRRLLGTFASFAFVFFWHRASFRIFLWQAVNFLGITIERIGSCLKRRLELRYKIPGVIWDVVVEPVVTIPLLVMSVLNSVVFCGSLEAAHVAVHRFFTESHYVLPFAYLFTHAGVTVRTWSEYLRGNEPFGEELTRKMKFQ